MLKKQIVDELWSAYSISSVESSPIFIKVSWSEIEILNGPGRAATPERWLECVLIDKDGIRSKSWFGKGNLDVVAPITEKLAELTLSEQLKMPIEDIKKVFFPNLYGQYAVVALLVFHQLTERYREEMPTFRNAKVTSFMNDVRIILTENVWEHFDPQTRYYQDEQAFTVAE